MMMNDLHYVVKAIQLYHPAGKREIRLVYRVFSKEHEGFSTRHQKSYSMTKFGEAAAWEKAREAFEYIEKTGEFPPDIELPPGALAISNSTRSAPPIFKKTKAMANASRLASAQAAMDIATRANTAEERSRQYLPPHFGGISADSVKYEYNPPQSPYSQTVIECPQVSINGDSGVYDAFNNFAPPLSPMPVGESDEEIGIEYKLLALIKEGTISSDELIHAQKVMVESRTDIFSGKRQEEYDWLNCT